MTNEEMQKAIQFILEQQAQTVTDIQRLMESHVRMVENHNRLTEATIANTGMIGRLTEAQAELTHAQARTDAKLTELAERLDAFIVTVEKYIAEGRNGNSRKREPQ
jgi:ABC-type transporter Mla subunit MlaD